MKILIYSDVHVSQDSSIVKSFGEKFSTRLEYIIKSLNWAEQLATDINCDLIFNLGDMFDKPVINAMEATAIQEVKWSDIPHYILVGNHDSNVASLEYSSTSILQKLGFNIINNVTNLTINNVNFTFLPYILEDNRKSLSDYTTNSTDIVLSHNDISDFNFGNLISKDRFKISEINTNCRLFLNGHLHNSSFINDKILNIGNLCGQNFSEDATRFSHGCWLLDTDDMSLEFHENPYALNFYKLEYPKNSKVLQNLKDNSVLMIKCERNSHNNLKEVLDRYSDKIVAVRVLIYDEEINSPINNDVKLEKVDHIKQFTDFIHDQLGNTDLVNQELMEVCK